MLSMLRVEGSWGALIAGLTAGLTWLPHQMILKSTLNEEERAAAAEGSWGASIAGWTAVLTWLP